ncbi:MAG TPA: glycogen debranching enzyme N-terminal domain-containing protein, partial [Phycisphaerae bacterium]|nr:glycogen debranching enzyme N-terminal domain-containing protein [Phycisphaerae bacterium]
MRTVDSDLVYDPIVVPCRHRPEAELLSKEWLTSNRIGAYASSTVTGCNTRRYHGLLVAATAPPMGRLVALSQVAEALEIEGQTHELATIEFPGTIHPDGAANLAEFRNDVVPTFVYRAGGCELVKQV